MDDDGFRLYESAAICAYRGWERDPRLQARRRAE